MSRQVEIAEAAYIDISLTELRVSGAKAGSQLPLAHTRVKPAKKRAKATCPRDVSADLLDRVAAGSRAPAAPRASRGAVGPRRSHDDRPEDVVPEEAAR